MEQCRINGCTGEGSRFGVFCNGHRNAHRRHGHPLQRGIRKHHLQPHINATQARIRANPGNPVWANLEQRWLAVVSHCRNVVAAWNEGSPCNLHEVAASKQLVGVAETVAPRKVIEAALAMYLMAYEEPHAFQSDEAFLFQLSRRVRGLAVLKVVTQGKHTADHLSPKALVISGYFLVEAFCLAGMYVARLDRIERERKEAAREELHGALEKLR